MSNTRIMDVQQKHIIRLYDRECSMRKISARWGIHLKTIKEYFDRYKTRNIPVSQVPLPQTDLVGPLSTKPPPPKSDKRHATITAFVDDREHLLSKPAFTVDNFYADYLQVGAEHYSKSHFYRLLRTLWNVQRGSVRLDHEYGFSELTLQNTILANEKHI